MASSKQSADPTLAERGSPDPLAVRGSPDPAPTPTASKRLLSLDAFRGLTILAMILVNNPGTWEKGGRYWPLDHAQWHGWTPTDLIFPFFLFIVGTSLAFSLRKYRNGEQIAPAVYGRIVRRTLVLIFLGLLPGILVRVCGYLYGDASTIDFSTLRYTGVLQRIAVVYFVVSLLALHLPLRAQAVFAAVVLLGYWALLALLPHAGNYEKNLSPDGNVAGLVDRAVFTPPHMYTYDRETNTLREKTEPEGVLSTFPAIVTSLLGYWAGLAIERRGRRNSNKTVGDCPDFAESSEQNGTVPFSETVLLEFLSHSLVRLLLGWGTVLVLLGLSWGLVLPINKKLWTSSYVLLSGGLAMQLLAGCILAFDVWGWRRLARPFAIVGINAIFVFVASGLVAILLRNVTIGDQSAHNWIYHNLFTSWAPDPQLASLSFAVTVVAFWWLVCCVMSRLGWQFRV